MREQTSAERRSLRYIRLAAHLAGQPPEVERLAMTIPEIEDLIGASLPSGARYPSWWRNDQHRTHSRAWLSAGWRVVEVSDSQRIEFVRAP
jgi:hypothetical protein